MARQNERDPVCRLAVVAVFCLAVLQAARQNAFAHDDAEAHSVLAESFQLLVQRRDGTLARVEPGPERTLREEVSPSVGPSLTSGIIHFRVVSRISL